MAPFDRSEPLDDLPGREANLRVQIHIYEALAAALDRRKAVFDVLVGAPNPDLARAKLQELLQIDEVAAQAVMDMQLRRLPETERHRIQDALSELRASLREVQRQLAD